MRPNEVATDQLERLHRHHSERLADAVRSRRVSEEGGASSECDSRQCRVIVNALEREIDQLRRGLFRPAGADLFEPSGRPGDDPAPDPLASPPRERKAYAPDPVGKPTEFHDAVPPDPPQVARSPSPHHVPPLGNFLDLVA